MTSPHPVRVHHAAWQSRAHRAEILSAPAAHHPTVVAFARKHAADVQLAVADAITAFAWESLVELARRTCAQFGRDTQSRALIPGGIAAAEGVLLIQPMSRTAAMRG